MSLDTVVWMVLATTMTVTGASLYMLLAARCKHTWEILSDVTAKSKFEVAIDAANSQPGTGKTQIPHQMCDTSRVRTQILACKNCGKVKRFVQHL